MKNLKIRKEICLSFPSKNSAVVRVLDIMESNLTKEVLMVQVQHYIWANSCNVSINLPTPSLGVIRG